MDNLRKGILVRNNVCVGAVGDKYFSPSPIGVVQVFSGNTIPRGYLACDGASYPTTEYPDLYAVIGNTYGGDSTNFNVPDYRETVLVGVGENTTDTIASHDVYELGEFKDDQLQGHEHNTYKNYEGGATGGAGSATNYGGVVSTLDIVSDGTNGTPRVDTTTHGKQKGVTYIIKAFHTNEGTDSGLNDETITLINQEIEGKAPSVEIQEIEGGHSLTVTDKNGKETFEVLDGKDGKDGVQINDSATNTTSVWSSSKTKSYVDSGKSATKIGLNKSVDTGWSLKRGSKYDFGKLVLVSVYNSGASNTASKIQTGIALIKGTYNTNPSTVEYSSVVSMPSTVSFEVSSSGTLIIKTSGLTGSDSAATYMFLN